MTSQKRACGCSSSTSPTTIRLTPDARLGTPLFYHLSREPPDFEIQGFQSGSGLFCRKKAHLSHHRRPRTGAANRGVLRCDHDTVRSTPSRRTEFVIRVDGRARDPEGTPPSRIVLRGSINACGSAGASPSHGVELSFRAWMPSIDPDPGRCPGLGWPGAHRWY